jgi:hypothetical protein
VILELVQKVLTDDNSGEPLDKLAFGVIGDLADAFPNGELKPLLLAEWIATSLVLRKGYDKETKTTVKWAREVRRSTGPFWLVCSLVTTCRWLSAQRHEGQVVSTRPNVFFFILFLSTLVYPYSG